MPQRTCINCKQTRDLSAFNTEHIIPQAFGRFEDNLTLHCVCSECNHEFGRTIDLALGRDSIEALLRFFHGVKLASEAHELRQQRLTVTLGDDPEWTGCRLEVVEEDGEVFVTLVPQVWFALRAGGWMFITEAVLADETKPLPEDIDYGQGVRLVSNFGEMDERLIAILARRGIPFKKRSVSGPPPSMSGLAPLEVRMREHVRRVRASSCESELGNVQDQLGELVGIARALRTLRPGGPSGLPSRQWSAVAVRAGA